MHHAVAVQFQPYQRLRRQRAQEQVALPARQRIAGVEGHAAESRRFRPHVVRLLHAGRRRTLRSGHRTTAVVDAVRDDRPAVVETGLRDVQFITAHGPVLGRPQLARHRMQGRTLHVAVAVRPDFAARTRPGHERIVRRHLAVGVDAHDLARQLVQFLRGGRAHAVVALGDEQMALVVEYQARPDMRAVRELGLLRVHHARLDQRVTPQLAAHHRRARLVAAEVRLGERQVDPAVLRVVGRQRHVQQAGLSVHEDVGQARDRRRHGSIGRDAAQSSGTLGDQHAPIGQEGERPGMVQPDHLLGHHERLLFRCVRHRRGILHRTRRLGGCGDGFGRAARGQCDDQQAQRIAHGGLLSGCG